MTLNQAYYLGRNTAHRGHVSREDCPFGMETEHAQKFWQGVRDVQGEDRLNTDQEWDR